MNVNGSLHFYSADAKELFFVFDDEFAQGMYRNKKFKIDDRESRRVYISVGEDRFIHRRTLNFSRKQTEIKVSLCSRGAKDGLLALTDLYDWFALRGANPAPFSVSGRLAEVPHEGVHVWELTLTEPEGLITAPDFAGPPGTGPRERQSFEHRREFKSQDLTVPGQRAEKLALSILEKKYPAPNYECLWRKQFLDSERIEIRMMRIIADIDVWDVNAGVPKQFVEVKAQKLLGASARPVFHLSSAEWRSYQKARDAGIAYELWLFQYRDVDDLTSACEKVTRIVYNELLENWLDPESYLVTPTGVAGKSNKVLKPDKAK